VSGAKFTPGPWVVGHSDPWSLENDRFGTFAWTGIKGKRGKVVAIAMTVGSHDKPEYQANARLIAAAPDLVEELRKVLEWATTERAPLRDAEISSIRAALAKAEGRQS
jgi:hypothetical protein